ncbi:MAG TPA: hypothetical protein VG123_00710 [Streptosporangiaceae bacterium]|nr:hypothetical protein [Streptosporangiaceae bacterium]
MVVHLARDVLIVLVLIGARLAWVHGHEYRKCRWCRPGGVVGGSIIAWLAGHKPRRRRRRGCWRCHGARLTRRWGAWHTHKLALALREAWAEWKDRE